MKKRLLNLGRRSEQLSCGGGGGGGGPELAMKLLERIIEERSEFLGDFW